MIGFDPVRRQALRAGAAAVGGLWLPRSPAASQDEAPSLPYPPEVGELLSKEYGTGRIRKVQQALQKQGLDALLVCNRSLGTITYLSNFYPFPLQPGLVLLPADAPATLFVHSYSTAHVRAMRQTVWIEDLIDVPRDEVSVSNDAGLFRACAARLKALGLTRGRIGIAGGEVDWLALLWLRERLTGARIEHAAAMLDELVVFKDEVELKLIRHAQRLIDEVAYPSYRRHLAAGAWETTVFANVVQSLLSAGADPYSMVLFDAGPSGSGTWAAGVKQRRIEAGDIVLSEPMPAVAGYQAERMFTFALGERIPESQKRGAKVVHEAYQMSVEEFRPGRKLAPLIEKTAAYLRNQGYDGPTVPLGHWIGSQNHEGPRFTREGVRDRRLEPGMVFSWHPSLVVPGQVRSCCSCCFVVTEKRVEPLSRLPVRPLEYV